jgi:2-keto-3-deoxy-L-rhamnonate aldolase RhmA
MSVSNAEVLLVVMVEDRRAIERLEAIASTNGVDLIAIGPSDLSQALRTTGPDDPRLKSTIEGIAATLKKVGKARMTFPMHASAYPLDVDGLKRLGVAYSNCNPTDIDRLMLSYRRQISDIQARL